MHLHSIFTSILFITVQVHTSPVGPDIASTNAVNSSTNSAINATIFDHTGHDITPSFEIRLYYPEKLAHTDANHSLSNRQATYSRPLNECPGLGEFRESFCTPGPDRAGSLQSYTIFCRYTFVTINDREVPVRNNPELTYAAITGGEPTSRQETNQRDGHCREDEICVPGIGIEGSASGKRMASCVRTEYFIKYIKWGNNEQRQDLDLEGKMASMIVSQQDGTTPIEVDTLAADTETAGAGQTNRCRDCVELLTDPFKADTNNLQFQTKLLTAGTIAGVLWLAIASG